jgi:tetratricopeptide (TPR) repeat protein
MGLFDSLFGKKKMTLEDADKKNDDFISKNPVAKNDENEMMRNASKLMTSGKYAESLELYKKLSEGYPGNKGLYDGQIGAAYYFLGDYDKAIEYYVSGMNNGGNKSMMDDNIWEATEALYNKTKDKSKLEYYNSLFPGGNSKKKAEKLLQS